MWPLCTANNFLWLLLPLLIGLLTGWWAWGRRSGSRIEAYTAPAPISEPPPPLPPLNRMPEPPRAAPLRTVKPVSGPDVAAAPFATAAAAIGIPAAVGAPDDLTHIVGIGPKLNDLLKGLGITRFDQIAAWGAAEIERVDAHLGAFRGRIDRDHWVDQAKLLASGAMEEWNRRFGGGTNT